MSFGVRFHGLAALMLLVMGGMGRSCSGEDLVQAHDGLVRYKLSNLRVSDGITGDQIAFDYRRVREGTGVPRVVARTDQGKSQILGLPIRIEDSGTIRLRDLNSRIRSILHRDESGIEFYFVVDVGPGYSSAKRYLVSNAIRQGTLSTRVKARRMTEQELAELERMRKSKIPPENLPNGYVRSTNETHLVPGAPILFGSIGEWKPGIVVALRPAQYVRVKPDDSNQLRDLRRAGWLAVSDSTLQKMRSDPGAFSIDVRTLPEGRLLLDDDMIALESAMTLLKGTPLLRESYGKWEDVFLISSDNVNVRSLVRGRGEPKVEFIPLNELAIRQRTLEDQKSDAAKESFAANVAEIDSRTGAIRGAGGAMATSGGLSSGGGILPSSVDDGGTGSRATQDAVAAGLDGQADSMRSTASRTWSDKTGKFEIEARMIGNKDGYVLLLRTDQRKISVPIDRLSAADREYLESQVTVSENPFEQVIDEAAGNSAIDYSRVMQPITKVTDLAWGAKSVAISPQNRFLLIGRKAASASLCELDTGRMLVDSGRMKHMGDIGVCGFTPDGKYLLIGGGTGVFEVYLTSSDGKLELKEQRPQHTEEVTAMSISRDGKFVLSGDSDKTVCYWEIETGKNVATFKGFDGKIKATRVTPDGERLLATDGKTVKVFSVGSQKIEAEMAVGRSHASGQAAAFSPDGALLAVGDGYNIHLWDLTKGQQLAVMKGDEINWSMQFAPDGRHLLSGGNGVIYVWDCQRQVKLQTNAIGKSFYVQALTVSPDGSYVAAPSDHESVVVLQAGN